MRIHFIAIGGSAMHNLALALHQMGYEISGSDDEIFDPARGRLQRAGLLPDKEGWDEQKIHSQLDAVILGMHARDDNPELLRARQLNLKIYSYPEFLYAQSKNKQRVVIGGSHGKTTTTAMIMHVLKCLGKDFDYMVGAQLEGFDVMVRLTKEAPVMLFEGDEYLSSPIDRRPKFHLYQPHIALLTGIAWDHINVFPTYAGYVDQFRIFCDTIRPNGTLIYSQDDDELQQIEQKLRSDIKPIPYAAHESKIQNGQTLLCTANGDLPIQVFGKHNLMNLNGARLVCRELGVSEADFYRAIATFKGASRRLEQLYKDDQFVMFRDFAHSPSKLQATVEAVKAQFPERELVACMELHTFSSLNSDFLALYKDTMAAADQAIVYYNPHTLVHKKLPDISPDSVAMAFGENQPEVYTDADLLSQKLEQMKWSGKCLLMMSSGTFNGMDLMQLPDRLLR